MQRNDGQRPEKTKKNELKNQEHKLLIRDSEKQMRGTQWSMSHYNGLRAKGGCIPEGEKKKCNIRRGSELRPR